MMILATLKTSSKQDLTERDIQVLKDIYKYHYLKASQIQELHFPSIQTANRRLSSLTQQALVKNFTVPNIPERIYYLGNKGAAMVAEQLNLNTSDLIKSTQPKDYYFMQHFLGINQFRITLTKTCHDSNIDLLGFIPEYYTQKTAGNRPPVKYIKDFVFDSHDPTDKISHTPDAVFALVKNQKPALFFLEIDRGTEVLSNPEKGFLKMIRDYLNYARTGKYKGYKEDFHCSQFKSFRLLIVTTTDQRLENMCQAIDQANLDRHQPYLLNFFWLTNSDNISITKLFQPVWRPLNHLNPNLYAIA